MAKDYLAIPAMSAPSESLFSQVGDIVSDKRNRLSSTSIKILAILKSRGKLPDDMATIDEDLKLKVMDADQEKEADEETGKESSPDETFADSE